MSIRIKLKKFADLLRFDNGLQVLLGRTLFGRNPITVYRYRGITALVDHSRGDQDGVKSCLIPGLYNPFLEIIKPALPGPVTLLDFGANTGGFPLALLANGIAIEKGISVELNPMTCTRLSVNLAVNGLFGKVEIINAAVCGNSGPLSVRLSGGSVSDSILVDAPSSEATIVQGMTVDELVLSKFGPDQTIDLCKIDIEGAEYDLFNGGNYRALNRVKWIIIEIHDVKGHEVKTVMEKLAELGFDRITDHRPAVENNVYLFKNSRR